MQAPAEIHKLLNQQQDASIGKVENERDEYATVYPFYSNRFHFFKKIRNQNRNRMECTVTGTQNS
jgi:hypothetical protein